MFASIPATRRGTFRHCLIVTAGILVPAWGLPAGDWPQILGPNRNGTAAADEQLLENWPEAGPRVLWQKEVGSGYAGIAVSGAMAILFHRVGGEERIEGLDAATGRPVWKDAHPTDFRPQVGGEDGPLCTPVIAAGKVITFGAQGVLTCNDLASGKRLWQRRTHEEFDAREGYFGAGSTPLVNGERVIVNVGGFKTNASVVAFHMNTGEPLWRVFNDHASYSSPIAMTIDGKRRVIAVTRLNCLLIDPESGAVLSQFLYGDRGPTVNAASPVMLGNRLFLSASYGIGAVLANVTANRLEEVWREDNLYSSQYCTPVESDGVLFGIDGRQDIPPAELKCFDPVARRVLWSASDVEYGTLIQADGKLLILSTSGELELAAIDRTRHHPLAKTKVLDGTTRAIPALANGRLYVRDDRILKCLQVGR